MSSVIDELLHLRRYQEDLRQRVRAHRAFSVSEGENGTTAGHDTAPHTPLSGLTAENVVLSPREEAQQKLRKMVLGLMLDPEVTLPLDTMSIQRRLQQHFPDFSSALLEVAGWSNVDPLLIDLARGAGLLQLEDIVLAHETRLLVMGIDRAKLITLNRQMLNEFALRPNRNKESVKRRREARADATDAEALLAKPTAKERRAMEMGEEILEVLERPTWKEKQTMERVKTKDGYAVQEFCEHLTREDCRRRRGRAISCPKVHFRRLVRAHTDLSLGDCSYLDTCRHLKTCKFSHYDVDPDDVPKLLSTTPAMTAAAKLPPPQWVSCDIRSLDMSLLGKFSIIMADPPWDIHMELPYGTMTDDEMRSMDIPTLQDDGYFFLWVTGRAMELGRECLQIWGYERVEELVWIKTNQLQRIIRTGRTGHWINHSKEHCLVGVKGNPQPNRFIDCDVLVAEVRETSRKPDEMYGLLERLSPGTRKVELFGRSHNLNPGWVTLGNQLDGVRLHDPVMQANVSQFLAQQQAEKERQIKELLEEVNGTVVSKSQK